MNTAHRQAPGALRFSTRSLIILGLAVAMFAITALAPAMATNEEDGTGDIEAVRTEVTGTFNYKIELLTDKMNGTDNADRSALYAEGIAELISLRDGRVATADSIDELWGLNQKAHDIYHRAKARANEVGETPGERLAKARNIARETVDYKIKLLSDWKGCDAKLATDQIAKGISQLKALYPKIENAETPEAAYALKETAYSIHNATIGNAEGACDGKDPRTKEEIAAADLKDARWSALATIERKAAILSAAAEAARNPVVATIFATAAQDVAALEGPGRSATSVSALKELKARAVEIYNAARDAAAELRGDGEADDHAKDPARDIESHLGQIAGWVDHLAEIASMTAEESAQTYEDVKVAASDVHGAIQAVMSVSDSGKRLDTKWQDLSVALKTFKRAFVAHHVAISDAPACYGTFHIPS